MQYIQMQISLNEDQLKQIVKWYLEAQGLKPTAVVFPGVSGIKAEALVKQQAPGLFSDPQAEASSTPKNEEPAYRRPNMGIGRWLREYFDHGQPRKFSEVLEAANKEFPQLSRKSLRSYLGSNSVTPGVREVSYGTWCNLNKREPEGALEPVNNSEDENRKE